MEGYIIKSGNHYLAEKLYWFLHEKDEDAWVHQKSILDQLTIEFTKTWNWKPKLAIPAKVVDGKTIVTGKPFKI